MLAPNINRYALPSTLLAVELIIVSAIQYQESTAEDEEEYIEENTQVEDAASSQ